MSFFRSMVEKMKDEDTSIMEDAKGAGEFTGFIDTGCLPLNAILSGSLWGGMPNNKVLALGGESTTGKTFFALDICRNFLESDPEAGVVYFDTEAALTKKMTEVRGLDTSRIVLSEPDTIQGFRTKCLEVIKHYSETKAGERPKMMMVLDSLGQLSSIKEMEDTAEGKDTRDMTKAQLIKGMFRVIRLRLARLQIPMIVTNHVYAAVGCLTAHSRVIMKDGSIRSVAEVQKGDRVQTLIGPREVTDRFVYTNAEVIEFELEDGTVIRATPNHKFLTSNMEWKTIEELSEGDSIVTDFS